MATSTPTGKLHHWDEVKDAEDWKILLLGNGMSINVWEPFGYERLLDEGARSRLDAIDLVLFDGTPNFERVLADLITAIRVSHVVGAETVLLYEHYQNIREALGHAVRQVHINRDDVPMSTRRAIRAEMLKYQWIFTTSYDLLVYWAMACDGFTPFADFFRGPHHTFDPPSPVPDSVIPVLYIHGALHLVVSGGGETTKNTQNWLGLLNQFGQPSPGDPQARPLLVTEGSADDKRRAIEANDYLRKVMNALTNPRMDLPTVVFGSSLSSEDDHLVEALSEYPRPVAISMRRKSKKELLAAQADIWGRLKAKEVYFYDAATHPLGSADLKVPVPLAS